MAKVKGVTTSKKEKKDKEAFEKMKEALSPGTSATVMIPTNSPDPELEREAESASASPSLLPEQNKVEIKRVINKVKALKHQIEFAFEHSQWACPTEIMDGLGKLRGRHEQNCLPTILARLEDNYGKFRSNVKISIAGAIEAQDSYAEILCVCFGDRCSVLYKLLRRNLHKEHRQLTREEKAVKQVKQDAPILMELKAVSNLICELINERGSPMTWSLSYRDGVRLIVDRCFQNIFVNLRGKTSLIGQLRSSAKLEEKFPSNFSTSHTQFNNHYKLGILECPYSTSASPVEIRLLIRSLEKDVKFLFGAATPGATKLEVLSRAFDEEGSEISKQKTFLLARKNLFLSVFNG